jgi:hypothetical protein
MTTQVIFTLKGWCYFDDYTFEHENARTCGHWRWCPDAQTLMEGLYGSGEPSQASDRSYQEAYQAYLASLIVGEANE